MGEKTKRRAVYMVTIAAMVAMTGGFVLATTISAITAPAAQGGGFASTGTPPAGVTNSEILISQAAAPAVATSNSIGIPVALTATTGTSTDVVDVNNIGGLGDFVETVSLTFSASAGAPAGTEYSVSIVITGSTPTPQVMYVETSSLFAGSGVETVNFVWDMGNGATSITISSVSDLITQCSSVGSCG